MARRALREASTSAAADAACLARLWQCRQNSGSLVHRTPDRIVPTCPWWLGLPALAGAPRLPRFVGLRYSPSQLLRQAGRSDLCSRHQHGSAGHSAWCVNRVTQLCRISQVCRQSARTAGLVALAAAHAPSDLQLTDTTWMTWVLGHAAWVCVINRRSHISCTCWHLVRLSERSVHHLHAHNRREDQPGRLVFG